MPVAAAPRAASSTWPRCARALAALVRRHEALRTCFPRRTASRCRSRPAGGRGRPSASWTTCGAPTAEQRARRLRRRRRRAAVRPRRAGRCCAAACCGCGADEHVLLLTLHHIVSDGWSLGVLLDELGALYRALAAGEPSPLPELPVQYADYARLAAGLAAGRELEAQLAYWRGSSPALPSARPAHRPAPAAGADLPGRASRCALVRRRCPGWCAELARRGGGRPSFMVLLAGLRGAAGPARAARTTSSSARPSPTAPAPSWKA